MLEEPQFSTPPSSPPLGGQEMGKQPHVKASSVTWCNDYLEVMGCEKPHNFRVSCCHLLCKPLYPSLSEWVRH